MGQLASGLACGVDVPQNLRMATASPPESTREKLKQQSERNAIYVLVVLGLLYAFFFLPEPVLALFQERFHKIGGALAELGLSGNVAAAIGFIITGQDILATCDLPASRFFRGQYPSRRIMEQFKCTQEQADYLWFVLFNPWQAADHPRNLSYKFTFQRGYACRFIFHVRLAFAFFTLVATITWAFSFSTGVEQQTSSLVLARGLLLILASITTLFLFTFNRVKSATGCWRRWQEINGIHAQWVREAVFDRAKDYKAAVALLGDAQWKGLYGYK